VAAIFENTNSVGRSSLEDGAGIEIVWLFSRAQRHWGLRVVGWVDG